MSALQGGLEWPDHIKQGNLSDSHEEAAEFHIKDVFENIPLPKKIKIKVALDTLGACSTHMADLFLKRLKIETHSMFPDILPTFPRPPEPNQKSLKKLSEFVKKTGSDIGVWL